MRDLLQHAYNQEPNEKAALFRIIGELADEKSIPELTSRIEGKDPIARDAHHQHPVALQPAGRCRQALQTQLQATRTR